MIKKFLLGTFCFVSALSVFSQTEKKHGKTGDELERAAYGSFYIEEVQEANYMFNTPEGEAISNIILKAYRDLLPIPDIPYNHIDAEDRAKVEKLISKLKLVRENPPSWQELANLEKERLIRWDKAVRKKSIYRNY
jgi:hypothetical protein